MKASQAHWLPGNRVTLLENGEAYYPRVFDVIAAAEHEVLLETYILEDDKVGQGLQQALLRAAGRGAQVNVLMDGWGAAKLTPSFTQPLLDAGVRLRSFEPMQRLFSARINMLRRMHRKLLVVDGRLAFVGGINYTIEHLLEYGSLSMQDFAVEIEGPLVGQIQAFCRENIASPQPRRRTWLRRWRASRRKAGAGPSEVDASATRGGVEAAFVTRDNRHHRTDIERQYRMALRAARTRVLITSAYFFPGYGLLRELRRAARRGVQVDLLLQGRPDQPWAKKGSELLYRYLIRAGVHIHEYLERPLHAKVAVVDDDWATIGSSNLDPISLGLNLEANVVIRDKAFAGQLRTRLEQLRQEHGQRVQLPTPGPLLSAWIALRTFVVFHAMRRFSAWVSRPQTAAPQIVLVE